MVFGFKLTVIINIKYYILSLLTPNVNNKFKKTNYCKKMPTIKQQHSSGIKLEDQINKYIKKLYKHNKQPICLNYFYGVYLFFFLKYVFFLRQVIKTLIPQSRQNNDMCVCTYVKC